MHLFYSVDRQLWESLPEGASAEAMTKLNLLCEANANASHPCIRTYANVGGKADLAFFILGEELGTVAQLHRDIEACFPGGALVPVYNYLSVTELSEYMPTEEDSKRRVIGEFRLEPGTPEFHAKMEELADDKLHIQLLLFPAAIPGDEEFVQGFIFRPGGDSRDAALLRKLPPTRVA